MTTTTTTATAAGPILALDLGKYKSVACLYRSRDDARFATLPTSRPELTRLIHKHRPAVVLIEACLLSGWVRDLCAELGVTCLVANTASEAWKFKHLKRKTDRDDALRLAEVYLLGKFPRVAIPAKEVREQRGLIDPRRSWSAAVSPCKTAFAPSWSPRACRPPSAPKPGALPAWPASPPTPSRSPTAQPRNYGGAACTWP